MLFYGGKLKAMPCAVLFSFFTTYSNYCVECKWLNGGVLLLLGDSRSAMVEEIVPLLSIV